MFVVCRGGHWSRKLEWSYGAGWPELTGLGSHLDLMDKNWKTLDWNNILDN